MTSNDLCEKSLNSRLMTEMKTKFTYAGIRVEDLKQRVEFYTQVLGRFVMALQRNGYSFMVAGSGLVDVPQGRLNEIPKVIQEHHVQEAERVRLLGYIRRAP